MPTPEWFAENPKISAYISKDLDNALKDWMEQSRIKKVSQALTTILEQHLGLTEAPQQAASGNYATLEQLEELQARVEALEKGSNPKKAKAKPAVAPQPEAVGQLKLETASTRDDEWMKTKEAHEKYGSSISYRAFRDLGPEAMRERFGLEADLSRKKGRGRNTTPWIRKA